MARLNIYIPDELHQLAETYRGTKNLSAICAQALREELEATDHFRAAGDLFSHLRGPSVVERELASAYGLAEVVICETPADPSHLRSNLGEATATYLDRNLSDGAVLGIAGGRQTWCTVRSLTPRRLRLTIAGIGVASHDPRVLHAHPNTLVTMLSLLYAPRADTHLVGSPGFADLWRAAATKNNTEARLYIVGSCAPFDPKSPFASLLGADRIADLVQAQVRGDFCGVFTTPNGTIAMPRTHPGEESLFTPDQLAALAGRPDARVVMVAGGVGKQPALESALASKLFNVLVTDAATAETLLRS